MLADVAIPFALGALTWYASSIGGGGGALILLPIGTALYGLEAMIPALAVAGLTAAGHRVLLYRGELRWDIALWLLPGLMLGAIAGAYAFTRIDAPGLRSVVGLYLIVYVIQTRLKKARTESPKPPPPGWVFALAGVATAAASTLIGAVGPVLNPLYIRAGALKAEMIGTKGLCGFGMQLTKALAFASLAALPAESIRLGLLFGAGAILGNILGRRSLLTMKSTTFLAYVHLVLFVSGAWMIWKAWTPLA